MDQLLADNGSEVELAGGFEEQLRLDARRDGRACRAGDPGAKLVEAGAKLGAEHERDRRGALAIVPGANRLRRAAYGLIFEPGGEETGDLGDRALAEADAQIGGELIAADVPPLSRTRV